MLKSYQAPVPVIIVGNINVGGSGKTPVVIALYHLLKREGYKPGIISRGYGGNYKGFVWVTETNNPLNVGDEPVLIARHTQAPMVVAKKRELAIEALLKNSDCNIILSDDGLQHYALKRDIEIAVVSELGNQFLLPAGPLREPTSRLKTVDFIVRPQLVGDTLVNLRDPSITMAVMQLDGRLIHAVAGIGNPCRFFKHLESLGARVIPHAFPDHYAFREKDLHFQDDLMVVMTEKDAVKCQGFANEHCWFLPVEAKLDEKFEVGLLEKLRGLCHSFAGMTQKKEKS